MVIVLLVDDVVCALFIMVVVLLLFRDVCGQCVVAFEGVRSDGEIAHAGIIR